MVGVLTLTTGVLLVCLSQHVRGAPLGRDVQIPRNSTTRFSGKVQAGDCSCDSCTDSESVGSTFTVSRKYPCTGGAKAYVSGLKVKSVDGSTFTVCTNDEDNEDSCYTSASARSAVECYNQGSGFVGGGGSNIYVTFHNKNWIYSAPLVYHLNLVCRGGPTYRPTRQPTYRQPTYRPTRQPSYNPTRQPTYSQPTPSAGFTCPALSPVCTCSQSDGADFNVVCSTSVAGYKASFDAELKACGSPGSASFKVRVPSLGIDYNLGSLDSGESSKVEIPGLSYTIMGVSAGVSAAISSSGKHFDNIAISLDACVQIPGVGEKCASDISGSGFPVDVLSNSFDFSILCSTGSLSPLTLGLAIGGGVAGLMIVSCFICFRKRRRNQGLLDSQYAHLPGEADVPPRQVRGSLN